jgi:hypothetical protein
MGGRWRGIIFCGLVGDALQAEAGMPPPIRLAELARLRLQTISFFLFVLLVSAGCVMWAWNSLRSDFPRLPRLSYPKALGLTTLWGLLFVVVLTMISGARELMTPGAWERREGEVTYKLKEPLPTTYPVRNAAETRPGNEEGGRK